jgi:hypothetical protein
MKTVLEVALSTKFNAEQVPAIIEILGNTPNPDIAAEIILGIYIEPVISEDSVLDNKLCTFVSYNKWDNNVAYTYNTVKKKQLYVNKDADEDSITVENYEEHVVSRNGKYITLTFPNETETARSWTQLSSWEQGASRVGEMQP